jgi:hypothetical protein
VAGDYLIFHQLNQAGAAIPANAQRRHDLLVWALRGGSVIIVSDILTQGPIGDRLTTHRLVALAAGWRPLSQEGTDRADMVDIILAYGAPARCNPHAIQHPSALTVGIYRDDLSLVHFLLSSGNSKELLRTNPWDAGYSKMTRRTAFHFVKSVEMLDLTQFGLDLNGYETDELLPLQIIADGDDEENTKHCRMAMFQYVLDRTCDVDATNNQRQTTLDYCYAMKHPDTSNNIRRIELLLEKGAVPYGSSPGSTSPDSASPGSVSPPVAKDTSYAESLW